MASMSRGMSLLIALDQLLNATLAGWPDETLSSRAYRCGALELNPKRRWVAMHKIINMMFFWQPEHCKHAYLSEMSRLHLPERVRLST